jgi:Tol biopolymer transport system component
MRFDLINLIIIGLFVSFVILIGGCIEPEKNVPVSTPGIEKKQLETLQLVEIQENETFIAKIDLSNASQGPILSPDGKHFAYVLSLSFNKSYLVVDGKEEKQYEYINYPKFSPDSKRIAYEAIEGGKQFAVVDGKEGKRYDPWSLSITFSPDSKMVAYVAKEGDEKFVVVDEKEGKHYDDIPINQYGPTIIISPDSKQVAYIASESGKSFVVVDGKEEKQYDSVNFPIFSPDSKRIAYVAQEILEKVLL